MLKNVEPTFEYIIFIVLRDCLNFMDDKCYELF